MAKGVVSGAIWASYLDFVRGEKKDAEGRFVFSFGTPKEAYCTVRKKGCRGSLFKLFFQHILMTCLLLGFK